MDRAATSGYDSDEASSPTRSSNARVSFCFLAAHRRVTHWRCAMRQHPLLRSWLLLVTLLIAACGQPDAVAPRIVVPLVAAGPATAVPAVAVVATASVQPQDQPDPTQEAYCQAPISALIPECAVRVVELPPMPAVPFDQAIQQLSGHVLLYKRFPSFLMIGDADSGASLWINGVFCPPRRTRDVYGEWSADGRFIAFICQDIHYKATLHVLDMQTADEHQIAQGDAVDFAWSPSGHRLLVAEQTAGQRAFLLDATTGAMTKLPVAPLWKNEGYPVPLVSQAVPGGGWFIEANRAAMAWSPDGAKIAVIAGQTYVLNADAGQPRADTLPILTSLAISSTVPPQWSHDGRFLYTTMPHQNHTNPLAPSSMWGAIGLRTEISTGVTTDTYPPEPRWSPDGKAYITGEPAEPGNIAWVLYRADGTRLFVIMKGLGNGPLWGADSQQIVFQSLRGELNRIIVVDLAGHEHTILSTQDPVALWQQHGSLTSPDGALLDFTVELSNVPVADRGRVIICDFQGRQRAIFDGWAAIGWRATQ
jgi:Tol biopolymer transport system component